MLRCRRPRCAAAGRKVDRARFEPLQQLVKALDEGPDVGLAGEVHAEPVWCHYTSLGIRAHGHACLLDPPTTDPQQASVRGVTVGDVIGGARDSRRVQPALSGCRHADRVRLRRRWPCCGLAQRRPGARFHRVRRCSKRVLSRCVHRDRSGSEHNGRRSLFATIAVTEEIRPAEFRRLLAESLGPRHLSADPVAYAAE